MWQAQRLYKIVTIYNIIVQLSDRNIRPVNSVKMSPEPSSNLILVWTMAKVGTTSLSSSLTKAGQHHYCCHYLNYRTIDSAIKRAKGVRTSLKNSMLESLVLRRYLPEMLKTQRLKVITSMRDPVARNVSAFYNNIDKFDGPDQQHDVLLDRFLKDYSHTVPLDWWEQELKGVLGFDIREHSFDKEAGYSIYNWSDADIFVMRADLPIQEQGKAVGKFLDMESINIQPDNLMSDKQDRADSYKSFLTKLRLPQAYVDYFYDSWAVDFFWNKDEIEQMRSAWQTSNRPWSPPPLKKNKRRSQDEFRMLFSKDQVSSIV